MGSSVRTPQGQEPLQVFGWVRHGIHIDLRAAVIALISGRELELDDDLEIHALTSRTPERVTLTLLRPGGPYKVEIDLQAVDVPGPRGDPRNALPIPDRWCRTTAAGTTVCQLFDCTVLNVEPHDNTP